MLVKVAGHVIQTDEILHMEELRSSPGGAITSVHFKRPKGYSVTLRIPLDMVIVLLDEAHKINSLKARTGSVNPLILKPGLTD